jgi:serine/threonine protein kinase
MPLSPTRWKAITPSEFPWEQEALDLIRERLPDQDPFRAWSNFEFIADDGSINEVDLLVLTPAGFFLVEIKSRRGILDGDAHTWTWREGDRLRSEDNPLILANRKAKKLAALLRGQPAFRTMRTPYLEAVVFCSAPGLMCRLRGLASQRVYLREPVADAGGVGRPGIVDALIRPGVGRPDEARSGRIDLPLTRALSRALEQAGIRPSQRSRRVGDYELGAVLFQGPTYQDCEATHVVLKGVRRRVRLYPVALGAGATAREMTRRAAEREFRILEGIQHPGILRAVDYTEHERGPALIFEHDPKATRLDHYLIEHGARLTVDIRLSLLRQIAEAVRYAHEKKLVHRALSPQSILVVDPSSASPRIQIFNWQSGVREAGSSGSRASVSGTSHLGQLVEDAATVYVAPEALSDGGAGESLDVFSLGALAYHLFAGQPPASTYFELAEKVREGKGLRITAVLNGAGRELQDLIQFSTYPEVTNRLESVGAFLTLLENVEQELTAPEPDGVEDPTEAKANDRLPGGFLVKKRLGKGSCAVVLLVEYDSEEVVLKIATEPVHNDRLRGEAEVLRPLRHQHIVELLRTVEIGPRFGLLMRRAGDATLAQRLRADGRLHLDLLQRFGEDLIQTVDWLEQQGVSHRDIKPDNIGVSPVGRGNQLHLVLFDFSLARTPAENVRAGTVPYLDPFLVLRRPPRWDGHAERFAVAMTLYEMATGTLPRWGDGRSDPAVLECEVTLEPELFDAELRDHLTAFFARALRREYRERFDNGEEMLRAWRAVFRGVDGRVSESDPGAAVDLEARLEHATLDTPVTLLGLSTRAVNALDRRNIVTVGDLLDARIVEIYRMPGVGHKTRREIGDLVRALARRFPGPVSAAGRRRGQPSGPTVPAEPREPDVLSVDLLARRLVPSTTRRDSSEARALGLILGLGEEPAGAPVGWPSQTDVATYLELTRARVGQILAAARDRWRRDPSITRLRQDVVDILDAHGGVMAAVELSRAVLTARGSVQAEPTRTALALAATRAVVEIERGTKDARLVVRRSRGLVLVARSHELADYAECLGEAADGLAQEESLAAPARVLETLQRVARPAAVAPVPPERLVSLAAAASQGAAVSSRLEIYPRGMPALRALRLAHGALLGVSELTVDEIRDRVAGRYPAAEGLPGRPELDALLEDAGWDFEWIHQADTGQGGYRSRRRVGGGLISSGSSSGLGRLTETAIQATETTPELADARRFEERLQHAARHGAFLALTVEPRFLAHAERELARRFPVERRSLETALIQHMRDVAARAGADWAVALAADGAPAASRDRQNLLMLVRRAVVGVEEELQAAAQATGRTLLLVYPGLLARYDQLDLLQRLRDRIGRPEGIPGLWVLIPSDAQHDAPIIDGKPVPVIVRSEWARIPEAWIRTTHRAGSTGGGPRGDVARGVKEEPVEGGPAWTR